MEKLYAGDARGARRRAVICGLGVADVGIVVVQALVFDYVCMQVLVLFLDKDKYIHPWSVLLASFCPSSLVLTLMLHKNNFPVVSVNFHFVRQLLECYPPPPARCLRPIKNVETYMLL